MSSSSSRPLSTLRGPPKGETSEQVGQRLTRNMDALTAAQNSTNSALESRISGAEAFIGEVGNLPSPGAGYRGKLWFTHGDSGSADVLSICIKAADGTYQWKTLTLT